jgi:hypothetical protein
LLLLLKLEAIETIQSEKTINHKSEATANNTDYSEAVTNINTKRLGIANNTDEHETNTGGTNLK